MNKAAGLELAVRAWWSGQAVGKEADWLKKASVGAGAYARLLRCGIPERVLQSGVQLGQAHLNGLVSTFHTVEVTL